MRRLLAIALMLALPFVALADNVVLVGFGGEAGAPAVWSDIGSFLTAADGSAGATWAPVTSATLEAGNVGVCSIAKDEAGAETVDGDNQEFTSATDAAGNIWTKLGEYCEMQTATVANGACSAIFYTWATAQLNSGAAITFTFEASTTRKAASCEEFSVPAGATVSPEIGMNGRADPAADPGTLSAATTISREHLFIRASAAENNSTAYTADTDYTSFTHTSSTSDSGTAATSMGARGEWRIATEATSAASDPTYVTADTASVIAVLNQDAAGSFAIQRSCVADEGADATVDCAMTGVAAGAFIVCPTSSKDGGTRDASFTDNSAGGPLTWTERIGSDAASSGATQIDTATFTAGGNITVSATWDNPGMTMACYAFTGAETSFGGATASATAQSDVSVGITTTRAGSVLLVATSDWQPAGGNRTYRADAPLQERVYAVPAQFYLYLYRSTIGLPVATYTVGTTAPSGQAAGTSVIEVRVP